MSYAVMLVGVLMVIGGGVFAYYTAGDGLGQGLILGGMFASLGIVVIALGRVNESIREQTDYFIEKFEPKIIRNEEGYEKLDWIIIV